MVQVDEKTIYILGGDQNGHKSQKTWVIHGDPITRKFKTKPGPLLKIERRQLSCAKMKIDGKVITGNPPTQLPEGKAFDTLWLSPLVILFPRVYVFASFCLCLLCLPAEI